MANTQHRLNTRVQLLTQAINRRVGLLSQFLAPPGQAPALHQQLSSTEALDWWRKHRYDQFGQQVLSNYSPEEVARLDNSLAQANEAMGLGEPAGGMHGNP